jgi:hypothetical protein
MLAQNHRQRMLAEMGYTPLRWRGRAAAPRVQPPRDAPLEAAAAPPAQPAPGPGDDPLWLALLRAAGAAHLDPKSLGWEQRLQGPPFDFDGPTLRINPIALRDQPQAKRALWKTLRALRRQWAHPAPRQG